MKLPAPLLALNHQEPPAADKSVAVAAPPVPVLEAAPRPVIALYPSATPINLDMWAARPSISAFSRLLGLLGGNPSSSGSGSGGGSGSGTNSTVDPRPYTSVAATEQPPFRPGMLLKNISQLEEFRDALHNPDIPKTTKNRRRGKRSEDARALSQWGAPTFSEQPVTRRKRHRNSHLGCATCKRRRIRCDETLPECTNCKKSLNSKYSCLYKTLLATALEQLREAQKEFLLLRIRDQQEERRRRHTVPEPLSSMAHPQWYPLALYPLVQQQQPYARQHLRLVDLGEQYLGYTGATRLPRSTNPRLSKQFLPRISMDNGNFDGLGLLDGEGVVDNMSMFLTPIAQQPPPSQPPPQPHPSSYFGYTSQPPQPYSFTPPVPDPQYPLQFGKSDGLVPLFTGAPGGYASGQYPGWDQGSARGNGAAGDKRPKPPFG